MVRRTGEQRKRFSPGHGSLLSAKLSPSLRTSPAGHYHIAVSTWQSHNITEWLSECGEDPAVNVRSTFSLAT